MHTLDYLVLGGYFLVMIAIGVYASRRIKKQEDYFMGGRSFGKLLQTFAAFGAGTGSSDPVNAARTTFTSGMSGMWSVMYWLFVTPFYWITGVWYRRMRHLTLGDWFVERYESQRLGVGYTVFGLLFFVFYGSMFFSAIGKVAAPLVGFEALVIAGAELPIEYILVPLIGVVVLIYGIAGGLEAAYYTDLVQGMCIILLSVILIPFGLNKLVEQFGDPATQGMMDGFTILHQQVASEQFQVIGATNSSEFPLHRIIAIVIINLVGIVVQPHFIATGGGSAKTEFNARVGLVTGNFLKRFCTVGWVLTALIAVALFADSPTLLEDPDKTWGVASKALLGPGLTGLMLACLLAALMSSVDAYMVVGSGLVVRNFYVPYINRDASEGECLRIGRWTGGLIVLGAVIVSLTMMNVFEQLQLTWVLGVLFAAPFWVGMYWRRATTAAAWTSVAYCAVVFFVLPISLPKALPSLRENPALIGMNRIVRTTTRRPASPADARAAARKREIWQESVASARAAGDAAKLAELVAAEPPEVQVGESLENVATSGGDAIFWRSLEVLNAEGEVVKNVKPQPVGEPEEVDEFTTQVALAYPEGTRLRGAGNFNLDFLLYQAVGVNLKEMSGATLDTLSLPPKIVMPFLVMIGVSLLTRRNGQEALDRYYAKMKTPVDPDPKADELKLAATLKDRAALEQRKIFPNSEFEFQKPNALDVIGFIVCVAVCFGIIALAVALAGIGG